MAETYSRLRRKRKRTHPAKCPCCISDSELEPENQTTASTQIKEEEPTDTNTRISKRKRTNKESGGNHADEKCEDKEKSEIITRSRSSSPSNGNNKKTLKKGNNKKNNSKKNVKKAGSSSKNLNRGNINKAKIKQNVKSSKEKLDCVGEPSLKCDEEFESDDDDVVLSQLKTAAKRIKEGDGTKVNSGKPKRKVSNKKVKSNNKQTLKEQDGDLSRSKGVNITEVLKGTKKKLGQNKKTKSVKQKVSLERNSQAELNHEKGFSKSEEKSPNLQLKEDVFNHLYKTLKSCMNDRRLSVRDAGSILLKISPEDLKLVIKPGQSKRKGSRQSTSHPGESVAHDAPYSKALKSLQDTKVICSDSEETISQAAEALVSFRSKSPITREESTREDVQTAPVVSSTQEGQASGKSAVGKVLNFSSSHAVQALMQFQTSNRVSSQISTPSMEVPQPRTQQMLPGHTIFPGNIPQSYITLPQTATVASLVNQKPLLAPQGSLPNFSQLATQLRQTLVTSSSSLVNPLLNPGVMSPSVPAQQTVLTSQAAIQPKPPPASTLSTTQLQVLAGIKPATAPQQAILPQQPLKAMEEVIGNVGSNVPSLMWAPPVVFLGSPQNLGGVPRNIMAAQGTPGVTPQDAPSYHPVPLKPKKEGVSVGGRSVQGAGGMSNVMSLGGRPILPRTQPRTVVPDTSIVTSAAFPTSVGSVPTNIYPTASKNTMYTPISPVSLVTTSVASPGKPSKAHVLNRVSSHAAPGQKAIEPLQSIALSTGVSARQAVKKLVSERSKTAELKREGKSPEKGPSPEKAKPVLSSAKRTLDKTPRKDNPDTANKTSEFNLEQAATALLSIGAQEGSEGGGHDTPSMEEGLLEDPGEEVVFTSKGVFRVGDVDVDPEYNRIGVEGYTCGKCGKIFTSLNYLARHIKRVCPDMSCRKWKCSMCDKAFRHPFGLQQHIYTHTGERPHKCPVCPKAFYSSNDLRRHSRIHSGERPYHCKHCDKSFATTISLKTHTYIHTGEKPHKCPQCPKTFATSSKLGRHIVTHSEQRPYSCEQCPKSFNRSGDLRRHCMTVHDGKEKTYDCSECTVTFNKPADLRRHLVNFHSPQGKSLTCRECNTTFSTPLCLKMHIDTYHREPSEGTKAPPTLFKCMKCDKTYDSAVQLEKHQQAHNPASPAGYDSTQFQPIAPRPSEQSPEMGTRAGQ